MSGLINKAKDVLGKSGDKSSSGGVGDSVGSTGQQAGGQVSGIEKQGDNYLNQGMICAAMVR
jgi:hypothetical protein